MPRTPHRRIFCKPSHSSLYSSLYSSSHYESTVGIFNLHEQECKNQCAQCIQINDRESLLILLRELGIPILSAPAPTHWCSNWTTAIPEDYIYSLMMAKANVPSWACWFCHAFVIVIGPFADKKYTLMEFAARREWVAIMDMLHAAHPTTEFWQGMASIFIAGNVDYGCQWLYQKNLLPRSLYLSVLHMYSRFHLVSERRQVFMNILSSHFLWFQEHWPGFWPHIIHAASNSGSDLFSFMWTLSIQHNRIGPNEIAAFTMQAVTGDDDRVLKTMWSYNADLCIQVWRSWSYCNWQSYFSNHSSCLISGSEARYILKVHPFAEFYEMMYNGTYFNGDSEPCKECMKYLCRILPEMDKLHQQCTNYIEQLKEIKEWEERKEDEEREEKKEEEEDDSDDSEEEKYNVSNLFSNLPYIPALPYTPTIMERAMIEVIKYGHFSDQVSEEQWSLWADTLGLGNVLYDYDQVVTDSLVGWVVQWTKVTGKRSRLDQCCAKIPRVKDHIRFLSKQFRSCQGRFSLNKLAEEDITEQMQQLSMI